MIDRAEYNYFRAEMLKRKTKPYIMHNEPLAKAYYSEIKKEYPAASIYFYDIAQYICLDDRGRRALMKLLKKQQEKQEAALQETVNLIAEVQKGGGL